MGLGTTCPSRTAAAFHPRLAESGDCSQCPPGKPGLAIPQLALGPSGAGSVLASQFLFCVTSHRWLWEALNSRRRAGTVGKSLYTCGQESAHFQGQLCCPGRACLHAALPWRFTIREPQLPSRSRVDGRSGILCPRLSWVPEGLSPASPTSWCHDDMKLLAALGRGLLRASAW